MSYDPDKHTTSNTLDAPFDTTQLQNLMEYLSKQTVDELHAEIDEIYDGWHRSMVEASQARTAIDYRLAFVPGNKVSVKGKYTIYQSQAVPPGGKDGTSYTYDKTELDAIIEQLESDMRQPVTATEIVQWLLDARKPTPARKGSLTINPAEKF